MTQAQQVGALSIAEVQVSLRNAYERTTHGRWLPGETSHHTATLGGYHIAEFRHANDATFCDLAHAFVPMLLDEIERLQSAQAAPQCLHQIAERADFELMREAYEKAFGPPPVGAAWASVGYAIKTHEASEARAYAERFKGFVGGWVWRSAQAAPVQQGWKLVPDVATPEQLLKVYKMTGIARAELSEIWFDMLAAAPRPPEAAPDCLTCNDHGAVGNILNAEPCPDCTPAAEAAPVQMPEPDFYGFRNDEECRVDMCFSPAAPRRDGVFAMGYYSWPKVRQLLADLGITGVVA